jgi:hypothetical protein
VLVTCENAELEVDVAEAGGEIVSPRGLSCFVLEGILVAALQGKRLAS